MMFLLSLHYFLHFIFQYGEGGDTLNEPVLPELIWYASIGFYILFVVRHAAFSKFDAWAFVVMFIVGAFATIGGIWTFVAYVASSNSPNVFTKDLAPNDPVWISLVMIIFVFALPYILAMFYSPKSFM